MSVCKLHLYCESLDRLLFITILTKSGFRQSKYEFRVRVVYKSECGKKNTLNRLLVAALCSMETSRRPLSDTSIYTCIYIYIYIHMCMCVCVCVCVYACRSACVCIYIHIYIYIFIYTYIYIYVYIYIYM